MQSASQFELVSGYCPSAEDVAQSTQHSDCASFEHCPPKSINGGPLAVFLQELDHAGQQKPEVLGYLNEWLAVPALGFPPAVTGYVRGQELELACQALKSQGWILVQPSLVATSLGGRVVRCVAGAYVFDACVVERAGYHSLVRVQIGQVPENAPVFVHESWAATN